MADRLEEPARQLADSIAHLAIRERSALWRYNVAVVSAAAALGARFLFEPWLGGHAPYVTYMVAVAATVWLAGFWPALLTAALGIPGAMIFLRDSPYPWTAHIIGMAIYVMAMVAIASLGRSMRVARAKAQEAADEARLGQEEAALAWREWEQTFDTIPDLIAIIDTSHKIVRANRAMAARLKINASACPGLACHHAVHDLDAPIQKCPHALAMADGCEHVAEVYEERLGGHFLISCTPMRDDAGRMIGTVHVARDITERIEAEEELRRSELFYRQTLESIPGMVFTTRADGYCDYQSQQWVDYTGVPMDEHMGSGWSKLLHPDDQPRALQAWNDAVAERAPYDLEYRVRRHDGQYEWFHVRARPIRDLSGRVVRWFGVVTNVEQFRRSQAALQESRRHLQAQAVELTRSNQDLEEFAHVASHDLKEPLGVMTMYLALLRKKHAAALDEEARQFIGHAVDAVGRMGRLINDLLAYSRVGRKTEGFTPTDMEDVLAYTLGNLQASIDQSGAAVTHDPLPTVVAERPLMTQLLQNLIGNAIKYRKDDEPPAIHVSAARQERAWLFSVRDNGIGIRPEDHERIFAIFQRLDAHSHTAAEGTGVGLAICKKIVDHHGGRIWVQSHPGQGSTFLFTVADREG